MKFISFVSQSPKTYFAPTWNYTMAEIQLDNIDWNEIKQITLEKEKEIINNFPPSTKAGSVDGYTNLGYFSLTSRYTKFNVFSWENDEIQKLKKIVYENYLIFLKAQGAPRVKVWIQCWANVMRKGEAISTHIHSTDHWSYLGGHICVSCENTSTVYINPINQIQSPQEHISPNTIGKLTFFPSNIPHYTTTHAGDSERISFAFDLIVDGNPFLETEESVVLPFDTL
jgi:Putative 2OG-Fe(II) oxygenase